MLFPLIASVIICLLQQGVGQDISSFSVCVNLEGNYLLVEWQPPFPNNAETLDVHCSSLNDSFSNSFTIRLSPEISNTIAVQVPVHGGGVHLGYIYIIQATLRTTDGIEIHSDPITVVANYFQDIYWLFKSSTSVTFHCVLSTMCSRVIGGCMVSLIRQADGQSVNQTIPVVGRKETVEGSFNNLNLSEPYSFTATAVRRDLTTPLGRAVSGIIPAVTFNNISSDANISRSTALPTPSVTSANPVTSLSTSVMLSSSLASSLSTTSSSSSITRSSSLSSMESSSSTAISTSILRSSMSTVVITPTLTGTGQDVTSGINATSSSSRLPIIAIIGIICGIVLLLVGIFAFVLTILNKMRPERNSSAASAAAASAAAADKQHRLFWPFNVLSSKRNGELHPSINVDCTLDTSQYHAETTKSGTDTSGYMKIAPPVHKQFIAAEYEIPIRSPPAKTTKAPVQLSDELEASTLYEMPTVPAQTAYLTEDFKKKAT